MERSEIQARILQPEDLPQDLRGELAYAPDHIMFHEKQIYIQLDHMYICLPDNQAGTELAYAITRRKHASDGRPASAAEIYEKLLYDPNYRPDKSLITEYRIKENAPRCVAVFRSAGSLDKDLHSIILSMAPVEKGDAVISADYQTAVLIKETEGQSDEEISEFIEAVIGTMESEGITDIHAGTGRKCADIYGIRNGYIDGLRAVELGMKYHRQDRVYAFEKQTLEMIVDSIPEEQKKRILQTFFRNGPTDGLSDELLETVRVFFRNDLNLTAASRQLFIHRNTLNYRLDKIRKDYGLDLRSFQDAVIFRVISEIAKEI